MKNRYNKEWKIVCREQREHTEADTLPLCRPWPKYLVEPPYQSRGVQIMCCHRRLIYVTCGHSTFSPTPLIECRLASIVPTQQWSSGCEIVAHPYKTLRLDQLCRACQGRRNRLLQEIEQTQAVRFDEWQWKVSYGMPAGGKDYWTKKMEDQRATEEAEGLERVKEKEKAREKDEGGGSKRHKSVKRFSLRRRRNAEAG